MRDWMELERGAVEAVDSRLLWDLEELWRSDMGKRSYWERTVCLVMNMLRQGSGKGSSSFIHSTNTCKLMGRWKWWLRATVGARLPEFKSQFCYFLLCLGLNHLLPWNGHHDNAFFTGVMRIKWIDVWKVLKTVPGTCCALLCARCWGHREQVWSLFQGILRPVGETGSYTHNERRAQVAMETQRWDTSLCVCF